MLAHTTKRFYFTSKIDGHASGRCVEKCIKDDMAIVDYVKVTQ